MEHLYATLQEKFPFLTYGTYLERHYLGIVQNCDNQILSMYVYNDMYDERIKKLFLRYGEIWWWESNRQIPINVFLKSEFKIFKDSLKTFARKEFDIIHGPIVSMQDIMQKRIKRRQIQLVRKIDTLP